MARVGITLNFNDFSLVNAFDQLSACEEPDEIWSCANEIAKSLGVEAINVAEVEVSSESIVWARSSMPQAWLDIYMQREFFNVDPLLKLFTQKSPRKTIYCDQDSIDQGRDGGNPVLSQGLRDFGYTLLHGTKFLSPKAKYGTMVTFGFNDMDKETFNENISQWTTIAALFAGFSMAPSGLKDRDVFSFKVPELTARELQVLSLLAQGKKTARIAGELDLAEITVAKHFRTGRQKLNAATREQAVITALRYNLISV